jgi:Flp pilus assembly pilin Flp
MLMQAPGNQRTFAICVARSPRHFLRDEAGQTVVEFALILIPLLLLVAGILQLGMAISFWQDQQRLATAGARVAVVNCDAAAWCTPSLARYLEKQPLSQGNRPTATVCFTSKTGAGGTAIPGDSIKVRLQAQFPLVPIVRRGGITLSASTTMRLERAATNPGIATEPLCT